MRSLNGDTNNPNCPSRTDNPYGCGRGNNPPAKCK